MQQRKNAQMHQRRNAIMHGLRFQAGTLVPSHPSFVHLCIRAVVQSGVCVTCPDRYPREPRGARYVLADARSDVRHGTPARDLVGYGPDPNAVVDRVKALKAGAIVAAINDKVACGIERADGFNHVARSAAVWTLEALTPERRAWLAALPEGPTNVDSIIGSATARRSTRTPHLRRARCGSRAEGIRSTALPLRPYPPADEIRAVGGNRLRR